MAEDKALDKTFRRDFADAGPALEQLVKLFKLRQLPHSRTRPARLRDSDSAGVGEAVSGQAPAGASEAAQSAGAGDSASFVSRLLSGGSKDAKDAKDARLRPGPGERDPSSGSRPPRLPAGSPAEEVAEQWAAVLASASDPVDQTALELLPHSDIPPEVSLGVWARFQEKRLEKLRLEAEAKRVGSVLAEMNKHWSFLTALDSAVQTRARQLKQAFDDFETQREHVTLNLEVLVSLDQGLVEVSDDILDMQAQIVARSVVEGLNGKVIEQAMETIVVMKEMSRFKRARFIESWEQRQLELQLEDMKQCIKDLQLVRVTRALQSSIKIGGDEAKQKVDKDGLERKLLQFEKLMDMELRATQQRWAAVRAQTKQQSLENTRLVMQTEALAKVVETRRKLGSLRPSEGAMHNKNTARTTALAEHRKLKDISALQAEEIARLTKERDVLRAKSFPMLPRMPGDREMFQKRAPDMFNGMGGLPLTQMHGALLTPRRPAMRRPSQPAYASGSQTHRAFVRPQEGVKVSFGLPKGERRGSQDLTALANKLPLIQSPRVQSEHNI